MNNKKWIFFDLDGTLIDVKGAQKKAVNHLYNLYNFKEKVDFDAFLEKWQELKKFHEEAHDRGDITHQEERNNTVIDLFKHFDTPMDKTPEETYNIYLDGTNDNLRLFDDVYDVLENFQKKGFKLGVISNGNLEKQTSKLRITGILGFFDIVTTSSEYEYSKPDLRMYESIIERFNLNKDEMLMIGDDVKKDVMPCIMINLDAIWLNRKNKKSAEEVEEINNLEELERGILKHDEKKDIYNSINYT